MRQYESTDFEWRVIQPMPPNKPRGVAQVDDHRVLDGIFWVLRTVAKRASAISRMALIQEPEREQFS